MAKKKRPPKPEGPAAAAPVATSTAGAKPGPARAKSEISKLRSGRRQGNLLPWILGIGGLIVLVAIQIGVNLVRDANLPGERFPNQGNVHVALGTATPAYNSDPPTSGWHTAELAPWGSHLEAPHEQRLLHNMEDGGVVLWYAHGTPAENQAHVDALEAVVAGRYARIVIAPRDGMPTTYALTAWRRLQRFDAIDEPSMRAFIAAYHGTDNHAR
ncbi:MAG: DUF3105 domain-containing protein [bacterium]|nr:DUF3105 domain-containing protein [bacterium]